MDIALTIIIIVQLVVSHLERKDFNDRLMAKNYPEYKDRAVKDEPNKLPEDDNLVELDQAEDLLNG